MPTNVVVRTLISRRLQPGRFSSSLVSTTLAVHLPSSSKLGGMASMDTTMDGADGPKKILYNMPPEMVSGENKEEEVLPAMPDKEAPEAGTPPPAPGVDYGDSLRPIALHLEGEPISQLSTSRLMAYVGHTGVKAKGIEWINDTRCVVVFESYAEAVNGLQRLLLYEEDYILPEEGHIHEHKEILLLPRLVMSFPRSLYTTVEEQAASSLPELQTKITEKKKEMELASDPAPQIYRDMELEEFERSILSPDHLRVKKLRQPLWVRFALHNHDTKAERSAQKSNWYRQHGRGAGKEVVSRLLKVGDVASSRRKRRHRSGPSESQRRSTDTDTDYTPLSLLDRIGGRPGRDWEDDESLRFTRDRSASPERADKGMNIRGRGSVRAPRSTMARWDEDSGSSR